MEKALRRREEIKLVFLDFHFFWCDVSLFREHFCCCSCFFCLEDYLSVQSVPLLLTLLCNTKREGSVEISKDNFYYSMYR
jgi:hypothetical protein